MTSLSRRQALAATAVLATAAGGRAAAAPGVATPADMALGNPKAAVTVVEYASLSCGHCAHFNETIFPDFKNKHDDTGRVRYVMKEFLTAPANVAAAGFLLARCGGGGPAKYFKIVDEVFRSQPRWFERLQPGEVGSRQKVGREQFTQVVHSLANQHVHNRGGIGRRVRTARQRDRADAAFDAGLDALAGPAQG